MKKVIIIPGLGDHTKSTEIAVRNWSKHGLEPVVYSINWSDEEIWKSKLDNLIKFTDQPTKDESKISVVGCSAGASAALNLFLVQPDVIDKAVSVCGRLRDGNIKGFRSLKNRSKTSKAFLESVQQFEKEEKNLTQEQRRKIMTIRARFGDELVPTSTSQLKGATNITVPMIEHSLSIYTALSLFSEQIINFLKN